MNFQNGVCQINLKNKNINLTQSDKIGLCFVLLGCSVSNMPKNYQSQSETNKIELFDPEKVTEPNKLPEYWRKVFNLHNEPERKDCVELRYRYVHIPFNIVPQYPRVPCKGIFCLTSRKVLWNKITSNDLIHIGTSTDEGW